LLFALPGLLRLAEVTPSVSGRRLFATACVAIPFVAWVQFLQFCIVGPDLPYNGEPPSAAGLPHWLLNELAWWWIVCVLLSCLAAFLLNSELSAWR